VDASDEDLIEVRVRFSMSDASGAFDKLRQELQPELGQLELGAEVRSISLRESSVGVGYSGPGFEAVLDVSRMILDDLGRLAALGGWILWLKERVSRKRNRMTVISDSSTMGAVAAASVSASSLVGYRFVLAQPITGWPQYPDETDERFVWVASFEHDERHEVLAVFMSPAGILLGQVIVPLHSYMDEQGLQFRNAEELADLFRRRNGLA
jgi:hypothetical protein